jgi:hypothetical protein
VQHRRVVLGVVVRGPQRTEDVGGQRGQAVLRRGVPVRAEEPIQPAREHRVGLVRVGKFGGGLHESNHATSLSRPNGRTPWQLLAGTGHHGASVV